MKLYWLLIPLILIFSFVVIWNSETDKFSETLPIVIRVTEYGNIDINQTKEPQKVFNFGATFPNTKAQKTMELKRGNRPIAKVHITVSGEIKDWTLFSKNDFILDKSTLVNVTIEVPSNVKIGTYTGNVTIDYINTYGTKIIETLS